MKGHNIMIEVYMKLWKIATSQGDDYTAGCLLDYLRKLIDLSKQQALDVDPKAIKQINFKGSLDCMGNTTLFFINEEIKGPILLFSKGTVRLL